jgi:hypothetical protein
VATDERERLGEKLGGVSRATQNEWANKSDRALLARLRRAKQERLAKEKAERRTPRAFNRVLCAIDFGQSSLKHWISPAVSRTKMMPRSISCMCAQLSLFRWSVRLPRRPRSKENAHKKLVKQPAAI